MQVFYFILFYFTCTAGLRDKDKETRPFVHCVCRGRPSYKGNEARCFIEI